MNTNLRSLICSVALLLAACGGGDDHDSISADAKVCELKQVLISSLMPRSDVVYDDSLRTPWVIPADNATFVVDYPFAPGTTQVAGTSIVIYVQEYTFRPNPKTVVWECALRNLNPGERVAVRGGPRGEGKRFGIRAEGWKTLPDGRTASSSPFYIEIEY